MFLLQLGNNDARKMVAGAGLNQVLEKARPFAKIARNQQDIEVRYRIGRNQGGKIARKIVTHQVGIGDCRETSEHVHYAATQKKNTPSSLYSSRVRF